MFRCRAVRQVWGRLLSGRLFMQSFWLHAIIFWALHKFRMTSSQCDWKKLCRWSFTPSIHLAFPWCSLHTAKLPGLQKSVAYQITCPDLVKWCLISGRLGYQSYACINIYTFNEWDWVWLATNLFGSVCVNFLDWFNSHTRCANPTDVALGFEQGIIIHHFNCKSGFNNRK